jgi:hypothetical protein
MVGLLEQLGGRQADQVSSTVPYARRQKRGRDVGSELGGVMLANFCTMPITAPTMPKALAKPYAGAH